MENLTKDHVLKMRDLYQGRYLGYWDIRSEGDRNVKIVRAYISNLELGRTSEKGILFLELEGIEQPFIVRTINWKNITKALGTENPGEWVGSTITLYPDHSVKVGGEVVGGIRVRPYKPTLKKLEDSRIPDLINAIKAGQYTIEKLSKQFDVTEQQMKTIKNNIPK